MDCCNNKKTLSQRLKAILGLHSQEKSRDYTVTKKIALIGNPNVGKSMIFNSLTGAYVTVSNYPGTTVEVSKGNYQNKNLRFEIIDTPGMYSMLPITDEERVARKLLLDERPDVVIHVIDAKNLERMLPLTLQLIEAGLRLILVLNIIDEAELLGLSIDCNKLEQTLGIPVISSSAAMNKGIEDIKKIIEEKITNAA